MKTCGGGLVTRVQKCGRRRSALVHNAMASMAEASILGGPAPRASILIVNYHAYEELRGCLLSIGSTVGSDVETIVVDHDRDAAAIEAIRREFPSVRIIDCDRNPGFAAGVNRAARAARGRYL